MTRSFFPDLSGGRPNGPWEPASSSRNAPATARPHSSLPRAAWLGLLVLAGVATTLAAVFASLWWRGELQSESTGEALTRMTAEVDRLSTDHTKQRRVLVTTKLDNLDRLNALTSETARLTRDLETTRAAAEAAEKERQSLAAQLEQLDQTSRQRAAVLDQERFRSSQLEQNLALTQNDLNQQTVEHEQRMDSIQNNLIVLRDTVTQRELEVRNITSVAQDEIGRTQRAAEDIAREAEWLASQLHTVTCERDRLRNEVNQLQNEVSRLQHCLEAERHENHQLKARIHQLECRIKELENRPVPQPAPLP